MLITNSPFEFKTSEDDLFITQLLEKLPLAFALCEVIRDPNGTPIDYRFLHINSLFEDQTGLVKKNCIGRTIIEIYPDNEQTWMYKYFEVVEKKITVHFADYNHNAKKHYRVHAFSPLENKFIMIFKDITDEINTEKALKISQINYKNIFDSMFGMFQVIELIYDENGTVVDYYYRQVNPAFEKLTQKTNIELIGKRAKELFNDIEDVWLKAYEGVDISGQPVSFENYSEKFNKHYQNNAWKTEDNKIAIIFKDISEQKQSEKTKVEAKLLLEKTEKELNEAQKLARIGSWLFNPSTNKSEYSDEMFYIWSFDKEKGAPDYDTIINRIHIDDIELFSTSVSKATDQGIPYDIEFQICFPNDEQKTIRGICQPVFDDSDNVVSLSGTNQDITEQKQNEKINAKAKLALEKTEKALNEAQKLAHIGSWLFNATTQKQEWSDEMFRIWGFEKEKGIPNYDPTILNLMHKDDLDLHINSISNAADQGIPYDIELRICLQNDEQKTIRAICKPVLDDSGTVVGLSGTNQDITEQKRIEKLKTEAKEKAEESDRLKSAFLANMSHEIRTPMNGILGFAALLNEPNISKKEIKQYTDIIEISGARMLNTINDIVDISKIEAGMMKLHLNDCNINTKLDNMQAFFKPQLVAKGLYLKFNYAFSLEDAALYCDREKLYSILTNLIKNSIKHTATGGIEVGYTKKDTHIEFYVKDTGVGISKEDQGHIFDRFIQAKNNNHKANQGTGLGLAISKAYVEILGGNIWVESTPNKGSTFSFTIPYRQNASAIKLK